MFCFRRIFHFHLFKWLTSAPLMIFDDLSAILNPFTRITSTMTTSYKIQKIRITFRILSNEICDGLSHSKQENR